MCTRLLLATWTCMFKTVCGKQWGDCKKKKKNLELRLSILSSLFSFSTQTQLPSSLRTTEVKPAGSEDKALHISGTTIAAWGFFCFCFICGFYLLSVPLLLFPPEVFVVLVLVNSICMLCIVVAASVNVVYFKEKKKLSQTTRDCCCKRP